MNNKSADTIIKATAVVRGFQPTDVENILVKTRYTGAQTVVEIESGHGFTVVTRKIFTKKGFLILESSMDTRDIALEEILISFN